MRILMFIWSFFGAWASEPDSPYTPLTLTPSWELLERVFDGDAAAANELAVRSEKKREPQIAIFWYERGQTLCSLESCRALARIYEEKGHQSKVETYLTRSAELANAQLAFDLGKAAYERKDYEVALPLLKEAADVANLGDAQLMLGDHFDEQGDFASAKIYYKKAVQQKKWIAFISLAVIFEEEGKLQKACDVLEQGVNKNPAFFDRGVLYFNLAVLHRQLGSAERFYSYLERAAEKKHARALFLLWASGKAENPEECLKMAAEAGEHGAHFYLASYYSNKKYDDVLTAKHMRLAFTHRDRLTYVQIFAVCFFLFFHSIVEQLCGMDSFPNKE